MRKWVFGVLTHLVTLQRSFHAGDNKAIANTRHAGSRFIWSKVQTTEQTSELTPKTF